MKGLLDDITQQTGLLYISDLLHSAAWRQVVQNIEPGYYSIKEWNEAVRYLCDGKDHLFTDAQAAKSYLLKK